MHAVALMARPLFLHLLQIDWPETARQGSKALPRRQWWLLLYWRWLHAVVRGRRRFQIR